MNPPELTVAVSFLTRVGQINSCLLDLRMGGLTPYWWLKLLMSGNANHLVTTPDHIFLVIGLFCQYGY
jgi:hypothetical protein